MKLQQQINVALLATLVVAVATFSGLILFTSDRLEHALLDTLVQTEADMLASRLQSNPQAALPEMSMASAWYGRGHHDHTPLPLRQLPPGIVHDVEIGQSSYHVLRRQVGNGMLTVAVDINELEQRESSLQTVVLLGGLIIIILLLSVTTVLSRRMARPLQNLAQELDHLGPDVISTAPLAGRFRGAEAQIIAEALDRYIQRLADMVERERGFASSASHELRTPVTVIRSSLELLQLHPELPQNMQPPIARAHKQAERLSQVLDGLMLLARDLPAESREPVEVSPVIQDVIQEQKTANPEAPLVDFVCLSPPPAPLTDSAHLHMLISNLLRNAQEHADGQTVRISLDEEGFSVSDQGPGIDPTILPHIFKRSRRGVESLGAGLGLYIAAEICSRHDWQIAAANLKPRGCRISVRFS